MISPKEHKDVALIVGPTASGKSALALELAKRQVPLGRKAVIINADSAQVYADLQILSARPADFEMEGIPHRLYGYIDGAEACSAARWADDAKREIAEAHERDELPILVGGTGLYVRTLLDGIAPIPEIDLLTRTTIRDMPVGEAHAALEKEDSVAAQRLHPADRTRIMRALEVVRSTGYPLDHWHQNKAGGIASEIDLHPLVLLPPREWIYQRCDQRFDYMIKLGARAEVKALLARDLPDDCPVMRAIGVKEISSWICGDSSLEYAKAAARMATRQYAKRQYTWFRNQCDPHWPRWDETINNQNMDHIVSLLQ